MRGRNRTVNKRLPPHLHRKGRVYYFVRSNGTRREWLRLSDNYSEALAKWAELEGATLTGSTVGDALDRFLRDVVPTKAPKTQEEYTRQIGALRAVFGTVQLARVQPQHVAQYLDRHPAKVAANREITLLSAVYRQAMRWGWTTTNPCFGIQRNSEKARARYLTDAEFAQLRAAASDQFKAIIDVAYLTAMRKGDLLALRVADATDAGLQVRQQKTGKAQSFAWSPALRDAVERAKKLPRRAHALCLFATRDGTPYTVSGFNAIWRRIKERAGLAAADVHFHDIRGKSLTDAKAQGGIDYAQVLAGHASVTMTERYVKARAFEKVQPLR